MNKHQKEAGHQFSHSTKPPPPCGMASRQQPPLNIVERALQNTSYRSVLHTTDTVQIVLYALRPGGTIPQEVHEDHTQFIQVVSGAARVSQASLTPHILAAEGTAGDSIVIMPGTPHAVANCSPGIMLRMWSLYTPPVFDADRPDDEEGP